MVLRVVRLRSFRGFWLFIGDFRAVCGSKDTGNSVLLSAFGDDSSYMIGFCSTKHIPYI